MDNTGGNFSNDEGISISAAVIGGKTEIMEMKLLEMEQIEVIVTKKVEHYSARY